MIQFGSRENEWEQMEIELILGRIEKEYNLREKFLNL